MQRLTQHSDVLPGFFGAVQQLLRGKRSPAGTVCSPISPAGFA
jgi:hypothetical protein